VTWDCARWHRLPLAAYCAAAGLLAAALATAALPLPEAAAFASWLAVLVTASASAGAAYDLKRPRRGAVLAMQTCVYPAEGMGGEVVPGTATRARLAGIVSQFGATPKSRPGRPIRCRTAGPG
jgi:hypothetical protein